MKNLERTVDKENPNGVMILRERRRPKKDRELRCETEELRRTRDKVLNNAVRKAGTYSRYVERLVEALVPH